MSARNTSPASGLRRALAVVLVLAPLVAVNVLLGAGAKVPAPGRPAGAQTPPAMRAAAPAKTAAGPSRRPTPPRTFPVGLGSGIAGRSCLICHSAMLATQQAKDSTGWEKTLAQMEKWGAPVTPAEHDTLRGYLLARFGPRPTPR